MSRDGARRRYRRVSVEEADRIEHLYTQDKMSSVQIGLLLDRDPAIVRRVLNARGIATPKLKWDAALAMRLLDTGMPASEISRIVGKGTKSIRQYAVRHGRRG